MTIRLQRNGFQTINDRIILDPCSDYATCSPTPDIVAHLKIINPFGGNIVTSGDYQCGQGVQEIQVPQNEGIYIVDVSYEKQTQVGNIEVGYDRVLLPVSSTVEGFDPPDTGAKNALIIAVDNVTGIGLSIPFIHDERVYVPTGTRFVGYALWKRDWRYGCACIPGAGCRCGYALLLKKSIRFNNETDMIRYLAGLFTTYRPKLMIDPCRNGITGTPEQVANVLAPYLAIQYSVIGAIVTGWEVDINNTEVSIEAIIPLGSLHGWIAIATDVVFGCLWGAAAAVWLAGVGAAAGCLVGAAVGFTVGITYHADELTSNEVEKIYVSSVSKINSAASKALQDLEELYKQNQVSQTAYETIKYDIENLRNISLEQLNLLKNAVEYIPLEKKLMYAALGAIGGIALSALLRR